METDHLAWKQFSKLIDVREREGGRLVRQKWSRPPASPEGGDRQIILGTVFKVYKREPEGGNKFVGQKWSPQQV